MSNTTEPKSLKSHEKEMNVCIRCAYCFEECPVVKETSWDTDGARGKITLAYGLLNNEIESSEYVAKKMFQCTFCRDCMEKCPSNVEIIEIMSAARAHLVKKGYAMPAHKYVVDNIQKTGNIYGDKEVKPPIKDGAVPLFIGCQYLSRPNKTKKFIKILEELGMDIKVQEEICCGFPLEVLGFEDEFEVHKKRFDEIFKDKEAITFCPTCTVFLKEGHNINAKHLLQVILEKLPEANLGMKVTFHDPCDFSRGLKIIEEPRQILKKLGVEVVEMKNSKGNSSCCGGGGGILMSAVETSDKIAITRVRQAIATGADTIVTTCPTCETVLKKAATTLNETEGTTMTVKSIEDIIWKGLKG